MDKSLQDAVVKVAKRNSIEPAALLAVVEIESAGKPFEEDGKTPRLLFERHVFYRELSKRAPDKLDFAIGQGLTRTSWDRKTQYKDQGSSKSRLALIARARKVDIDCANRSASWGVGQTMGFNAEGMGFATATEMLEFMMREGVSGQIDCMVREIKRNKLDAKLKRHDWPGFAKGYNGAGYAQNQYDVKMEAAYHKWINALNPHDPETGAEPVIIPQSRVAEPESMATSSIGNGSIAAGGAAATGGGILVVDKILDHVDDVPQTVWERVFNILTTPSITVAVVLLFGAIGVCGFIWWKRHRMKAEEGV